MKKLLLSLTLIGAASLTVPNAEAGHKKHKYECSTYERAYRPAYRSDYYEDVYYAPRRVVRYDRCDDDRGYYQSYHRRSPGLAFFFGY